MLDMYIHPDEWKKNIKYIYWLSFKIILFEKKLFARITSFGDTWPIKE
jgi:hypothetical protein